MSANLYAPHLLVIPEDDANREIVNGFRNHLSIKSRQIQVENVAGGWQKALETFSDSHLWAMRKYPKRYVLILIDSDGRENRIAEAKRDIPADLADRVFLLGSLTTPEELTTVLGLSKEKLGEAIAGDCRNQSCAILGSALLVHNMPEWQRMQETICPSLWE